jgi:hypothetical protein
MDPTDERNVSVKIYAESEWQKTRCLRKYFEAQLVYGEGKDGGCRERTELLERKEESDENRRERVFRRD